MELEYEFFPGLDDETNLWCNNCERVSLLGQWRTNRMSRPYCGAATDSARIWDSADCPAGEQDIESVVPPELGVYYPLIETDEEAYPTETEDQAEPGDLLEAEENPARKDEDLDHLFEEGDDPQELDL